MTAGKTPLKPCTTLRKKGTPLQLSSKVRIAKIKGMIMDFTYAIILLPL
jgi:hypothetical protein